MNSYENESLSYECDLTAERDRLRERVAILTGTLLGVRGLAEIERANGSNAWAKAIAKIDDSLKATS